MKVEALGLLQAEANKLRVEKEFLEKQLVSKDFRIAELEGELQELTGEMAGAFDEGFQEALTQASCENPGITVSNCDPTHHMSSTEKSCLSNWMTEPPTLSCCLYFFVLFLSLLEIFDNLVNILNHLHFVGTMGFV